MPKRSELQVVYFPDSEWYARDAARWMAEHRLKPIKYSHEHGNHRFRLKSPYLFSHFITKRTQSQGHTVYLVIGFREGAAGFIE
jgi:hypothetical protein